MQCLENGRLAWRINLAQVADDPESLYLRVCALLPSCRRPMKAVSMG